MFSVTLTYEEMVLLCEAMSLATEDQREYERSGDPDSDWEGDPEGLAQLRDRPRRWRALEEKLLAAHKANLEEER